jgi:rhodanese-related sulfurtransferase
MVYLTRGELKLDHADGSSTVLVGAAGDALRPLGKGGQTLLSSKAITDVELLRFDEDMLDIMMTWDQLADPSAKKREACFEPDATLDWRTMSGMFAARSLTQGAFAALPPANIDTLLNRFERIKVKRGCVVISQGDAGDYYYLIEAGRAVVTRDVAGAKVELAELKAGDAFGEEALVAETTRNATVAMKTDGTLLRLKKADFVDLLREPLLQRVSWGEAERRMLAGATWIDVRYSAEFQCDGLPEALNLPLNELRQASSGLDPSTEYFVYCQSGRRSSAAAFILSQRGFRAHVVEGGLRGRQASEKQVN